MSDREKLIELMSYFGDCQTSEAREIVPDTRIAEIADHLISNGVTVQKWIPVDLNKHAYTGNRLIVLDDGFVTVGYQSGYGLWVYWRDGITRATFDVSYWMPLPEPPRECK